MTAPGTAPDVFGRRLRVGNRVRGLLFLSWRHRGCIIESDVARPQSHMVGACWRNGACEDLMHACMQAMMSTFLVRNAIDSACKQ